MYEMQKKFSGNLHALRGLAAVSVVFFHAKNMPPHLDVGYLSIVQQFGAGVTLFFILSGFSLSLSNFDKIDNPKWLYGYTLKRLYRILPIWYTFIAIHFIYKWIKFGKIHSFSDILYHVIPFYPLVPGGHESMVWAGWTIGVELMFYVLFPFLLVALKNNYKSWLLVTCLLILISLQFRSFAPEGLMQSFYYMGFSHQAFIFILGCALYFMTAHFLQNDKSNRLYSIVMCVICLLSFVYWWMTSAYPGTFTIKPFSLVLKSIALGSLVVVAYINVGNWIRLYNPVTRFMGDKSYTIYLAHPIVVAETKRIYPSISEGVNSSELSFILYSLLVVGITCIVAAVLSNLIEAPMYKKGKLKAENQ